MTLYPLSTTSLCRCNYKSNNVSFKWNLLVPKKNLSTSSTSIFGIGLASDFGAWKEETVWLKKKSENTGWFQS